MAGNPQRRGRSKKSGGRDRTLPADERPWHKAYSGTEPVPRRTAWKQEKERRAAESQGRAPKVGRPGTKDTTGQGATTAASARPERRDGQPSRARVAPGRRSAAPAGGAELLVGRNPVVEALRTRVPATALYVAQGVNLDDRLHEIVRTAADRGLAIMEVSRAELDRLTGGVLHQGVGLSVPPFAYEPFEDVLAAAAEHSRPEPLLVALDGVTDPRNLGAVIRSAAAFGAHGVFLPERRAAGITATAWRTSAGAAARVPVARVKNLTRALKACQDAGFLVVGLDADAELDVDDLAAATSPLVVVVGSEGRGLSRLVGQTCDLRVAIPMSEAVDSLNASVAAAVVLAEVNRRRRAAGAGAS